MIPLFGAGLQGKSPVVTSQYRLNVYYEFQKEEDKTRVAIYGTPGLLLKLDLGDTQIRGMYAKGDFYYVVHRGTFYRVNNANIATAKGTLNTTEGDVDIKDNGRQIMLTDETNGYIYDIARDSFFPIRQISTGQATGTTANKLVDSGAAFTTDGTKIGMIVYNITDSTKATITAIDSATTLSVSENIFASGEDYEVGTDGFVTPSSVEYMDKYFIASEVGTNKFQVSAIDNGADWDALEFGNADNQPDDAVRVIENNAELVIFCESSTEFHVNTGALDFPFQRVAANDWGLAAKESVAKFDNGLMFLARNADLGEVILAQMNGHVPMRVSESEWEHIINGYADVSTATAYSYLLDGHPMYRINFAEGSWEYDGSTGIISEIKSTGHTRHLSNKHVYHNQLNLVGDYASGKVYALDKSTYSDNGVVIKRQLRGKHIFDQEWNKVIVDRLEVYMETGVGLATGQGSDPQAVLKYSKDGGRSWGNEIWRTFGKIGKYLTRVKYTRMGAARDWVFELTITDPVKVVITNVAMRYRNGSA
jgi:hypothetical protein